MKYKKGGVIDYHGYVDASFGCHQDGKSHSGMAVFLDREGSGSIYWKSNKQTTTADSVAEAELISLNDNIKVIILINNILGSIYIMRIPVTIHEDNTAVIDMMEVGKSTLEGKRKFIRRKFFICKEYIELEEVRLEATPTTKMRANCLTKPARSTHLITMCKSLFGILI